MNRREISMYDNSDMFSVLSGFPSQIEEAVEIGNKITYGTPDPIDNIVICGLGGSAIGGDLLRSYVHYQCAKPVHVNRTYLLPAYANEKTLAIISSYSGNTEETLSCYEEAKKSNCHIICLSSGGQLTLLAQNEGHPVIKIPKGYQPRCALAYSFFPLLIFFSKMGFITLNNPEIVKTILLLRSREDNYSSDSENNNAHKLARMLSGKLPVIYSTSDVLDVVNLRWRGQIEENAKTLAYGNFYPEFNHNEIVGWQENPGLLKKIAVISLIDKEDHPRNKKRNEIIMSIISPLAGMVVELDGEGESKLERMFDLIYLGDWVSFYLAIINKIDPTPVDKINLLKNKLAEN